MEKPSVDVTTAAERILAILLEGRNMADDNKLIESMDDWQWVTDTNITNMREVN